jgi:cytochrome c biogenesis protein CcdA
VAPLLKIIPSNQYSSFIWFILTVLIIPLAIYYAFFNVLRTKINENKNLFKAATTLWYLLIAGTFGVFKMFPLNNDWMNIYDAISYIFAGAAFFITFLRYYIDFKSI